MDVSKIKIYSNVRVQTHLYLKPPCGELAHVVNLNL